MDELAGVGLLSDARYQDLALGARFGPFPERLDAATRAELRGDLGVLAAVTLRALRRALDGIVPGGVLVEQSFSVLETLPADGELSTELWVSGLRHGRRGQTTTFRFAVAHEGRVKALVDWSILAPREVAA